MMIAQVVSKSGVKLMAYSTSTVTWCWIITKHISCSCLNLGAKITIIVVLFDYFGGNVELLPINCPIVKIERC